MIRKEIPLASGQMARSVLFLAGSTSFSGCSLGEAADLVTRSSDARA